MARETTCKPHDLRRTCLKMRGIDEDVGFDHGVGYVWVLPMMSKTSHAAWRGCVGVFGMYRETHGVADPDRDPALWSKSPEGMGAGMTIRAILSQR